MPNESRVTARDVDAMSLGAVQLGDGGDRAHPNANALIVGQRYDPREPAMILSRDHRDRGTEVHWNAFPCC